MQRESRVKSPRLTIKVIAVEGWRVLENKTKTLDEAGLCGTVEKTLDD